MFDIGATELLLVAIIGLVVVGPERLPRLARSRWAVGEKVAGPSVVDPARHQPRTRT